MIKNNKSGFSLVELMVVVAIIGILATIAVPNFQRFQARAKQTSAKTELSGIYTAQKAFYVEYNTFTPDLQLAGFVPEGVTLAAGTITASDINRIYGSTAGKLGEGDSLTYADLGLSASDSYGQTAGGAYPSHAKGCELADNVTEVQAIAGVKSGKDVFLAGAIGCPKGGSSQGIGDTWTISETRTLKNIVNGI